MKYLSFNTKPQIIINKKINTITFERVYPFPFKRKELAKVRMLCNLLTYSTKDFPQESLYSKEKTKKLIMGLNVSPYYRGENLYLTFSMQVPREGITDAFNLDDAFKLFVDSIFKPNATKNKFDEKAFEREYNLYLSDIKESQKDFYSKVIDNCMTVFDEENLTGISSDAAYKYVKSLTNEELYKYYQDIISSKPINIIYGNTSKKRIEELYKQYNLYEEDKFKIEEKYFKRFAPVTKVKERHEHIDYNQSCLFYGFKIKDYTLDDHYYFQMISNLIDGKECRMLFDALRIDNQLVYHYSTNGFTYHGGFTIYAYLNKKNIDKAKELIMEVINKLKDRRELEERIKRIIQGYKYDLVYDLDNYDAPYREYTRKLYDYLPGLKDTLEFYENMDIDKFIEFANRIEVDTIYVSEGDKDDEI